MQASPETNKKSRKFLKSTQRVKTYVDSFMVENLGEFFFSRVK